MSKHPSSPAARESVEGAVQPRFGEVHIRNRGRLPHWDKDSGLYFITFRLADSLPKQVVQGILERNKILRTAKLSGIPLSPQQKVRASEYSATKIEEYADHGAGACILRDPRIAAAIAEALTYWHGTPYRLAAWCIMPNHVHVVCRMLPGFELGPIVKSWKAHGANVAGKVLKHTGTMWQREYYERLIRKEGELERAISYVLQNPVRAGLRDWPWVWAAGVDTRATAGLETGATVNVAAVERSEE